MQELDKILEEIEEIGNIQFQSYTKPLIAVEDVIKIIRKHMNDGWIPVEERLPENEAREYIDAKYGGIGYLYPCLVTYKNPVTRRVYTASFYYDIHQKWFVNIGENLLPRNNVFAWMPLPESYRPERSKGE